MRDRRPTSSASLSRRCGGPPRRTCRRRSGGLLCPSEAALGAVDAQAQRVPVAGRHLRAPERPLGPVLVAQEHLAVVVVSPAWDGGLDLGEERLGRSPVTEPARWYAWVPMSATAPPRPERAGSPRQADRRVPGSRASRSCASSTGTTRTVPTAACAPMDRARRTIGAPEWFCVGTKTPAAARTASAIARPSSRVAVMGVSDTTWMPAARKGRAAGQWRWFCVTTETASMPSGRAASSRAMVSNSSWERGPPRASVERRARAASKETAPATSSKRPSSPRGDTVGGADAVLLAPRPPR